jgi:hypothetical protein
VPTVIAGGTDPNERQFPQPGQQGPGQAPITPVIPQQPMPKNPFSPAFPDA